MRNIRVGLLGGISYESTLKYYQLFLEKYYEIEKSYAYPEVMIFSLNFQKVIDYELNNEKTEYIQYLTQGIKALENAEVNFIIITANSPHAVFNQLQNQAKVPILSIVKATAKKAIKENMKRLLLLGIKFTMQSTFYQKTFTKQGMEIITPSEKEQEKIERIIFDELVVGSFEQKSKKVLLDIIGNYEVDGVILGCTELPLVLKQNDSDLNFLDTLEIHVEYALNYYLSLLS